MEKYKQEFIEFMVDCGVLKFGDFVTKSGRKTPFFVNTGFYRTGTQLRKLGEYYAKAINDTFGTDFDVLFGPAYKGIPLRPYPVHWFWPLRNAVFDCETIRGSCSPAIRKGIRAWMGLSLRSRFAVLCY